MTPKCIDTTCFVKRSEVRSGSLQLVLQKCGGSVKPYLVLDSPIKFLFLVAQ